MNERGGIAPILLAAAFVTFLGMTAGAMNYLVIQQVKRSQRELAKSEGLYVGEVASWHNLQLRRGDLAAIGVSADGKFKSTLDSTYALNIPESPAGCSNSEAGVAHSLGCTMTLDGASTLTQGLRGDNLAFAPNRTLGSSEQYCSDLDYNESFSVKTCLVEPKSIFQLTFLDTTGRTIAIEWDSQTQSFKTFNVLTAAPNQVNPRIQSAKLNGGSRVNYEFPDQPLMDAATGASLSGVGLQDYLLRTDGAIVSGGSLIVRDPKIVSLSFEGDAWYYLRSDGAVFVGSNDISELLDPTKFQPIEGLRIPTARALLMGSGPANPTL